LASWVNMWSLSGLLLILLYRQNVPASVLFRLTTRLLQFAWMELSTSTGSMRMELVVVFRTMSF